MSAPTDPCHCGHFLASHVPIENNARGACYDPASACTCRRFDADLPLRRRAA